MVRKVCSQVRHRTERTIPAHTSTSCPYMCVDLHTNTLHYQNSLTFIKTAAGIWNKANRHTRTHFLSCRHPFITFSFFFFLFFTSSSPLYPDLFFFYPLFPSSFPSPYPFLFSHKLTILRWSFFSFLLLLPLHPQPLFPLSSPSLAACLGIISAGLFLLTSLLPSILCATLSLHLLLLYRVFLGTVSLLAVGGTLQLAAEGQESQRI